METYSFTNIGSRSINEDYIKARVENDNALFVVCDGLGGHDKGEVASEFVTEHIIAEYDFNAEVTSEIGRVIKNAQNALMQKQIDEHAPNAMKTTVVLAVVKDGKVWFGHVGDSRGYAFKKLFGYKRTTDHSVPQMLVMAGKIKESDIRHHSERSSLLRVLGSPWDKEAYEVDGPFAASSLKGVLLCTDGFWELIEEKDMTTCRKKASSAKEWVESMAVIVHKNGAGTDMDNNTAGVIYF